MTETITAGELIAWLEKLDPNTPICIPGEDGMHKVVSLAICHYAIGDMPCTSSDIRRRANSPGADTVLDLLPQSVAVLDSLRTMD